MYWGAPLSEINHLVTINSYSLIEISNAGVNAFFIQNDYLTSDDLVLKSESVFRAKVFRTE